MIRGKVVRGDAFSLRQRIDVEVRDNDVSQILYLFLLLCQARELPTVSRKVPERRLGQASKAKPVEAF